MAKEREYSNKLHYYRGEVLGWTKAELAKKSNMSDKTITKVERDDKGSIATRTRIRNAINLGLKELNKPEIDDNDLWLQDTFNTGVTARFGADPDDDNDD